MNLLEVILDDSFSYRSKKDELELITIKLLGERYVAKVTAIDENAIIESTDSQVFNIMLVIFVLAVKFEMA